MDSRAAEEGHFFGSPIFFCLGASRGGGESHPVRFSEAMI